MVVSSDSRPPLGQFRVRPARRGDGPSLVQLVAEVGAVADPATVTWIISHPEMEMSVAADSLDKAIGVITLAHRPHLTLGGRAATIDELVVARPWRRRGVARALLKRVVERAKVLSVTRLEVQTLSAPDEVASAFLRACGFVEASALVYRLK